MAVTGKGAFPLRSTWGRGRGRGTDLLRTPIFTSSEETARAVVWSDWFFEAAAVGGSTGQIKVWNGSAWVAKPMKWYNGSTWVVKPVKFYNGSTWEVTPY